MKQTLSMLIALLLCLFAFASCDNVSFQNDDSQTTNDTPVCSRINLCYHGNKDTSITIEDAGICSELMTLITKADGTQGESSKGYYGVPYTLTIYFEGNEAPFVFCLWSDSQYSTSEQRDAEGYQYFFNDDLSDLYQYLEEKYPDEFWYSNNSQSGDSNTECVHTYGEWQYDETYHWCDWSCSLELCDIDTVGEHIDKDGDNVCDTCNYMILNCVHTYGEWQYNETHHWCDWTCSLNMCRIETTGEHFDEDENDVCDKCGYFLPNDMDDAEVPEVLIKIEKWNGDKFEGIVANPLFSYLEVGDKVSVICENETIASEAQYSIGTLVVVRFGRFDANVQPNILYAEAVENGEPDVPIDSNNSQSGDNNNYVTIETAVSDVMPPYAISCKIPTEYSTDNTTIPIILSFGLVEGCDADTDNYSEIVLRAENDEGQTIIIKRINISEILKSEYFVESVWDDNREWIIGFNYTHSESFALPLSLFSGTSGQIYVGLYECSSVDAEDNRYGSGAYIVLYYTRNESSITISAEEVRK